MRQIAILGFGVEGKSAYEYFSSLGDEVTVCDAREDVELPKGVRANLGDSYLNSLEDYDLVVRSPGILPYQLPANINVTSVMNEFLADCPEGVITIGVTGSKGKGTTSAFVYEILKTAGLNTFLGGNIGIPPLDFIDQLKAGDYVVLEMSNLQLWDITRSPDIAVLLMITPDHMDWHRGDMDEYVATKANITKYQNKQDLLVHHPDNQFVSKIVDKSVAQKLAFMNKNSAWVDDETIKFAGIEIAKTSDVNLVGKHNLENICAGISATWDILLKNLGDEEKVVDVLNSSIKSYKGLPHRLEFVAKKAGVRFYDDSIGTTPEAAIAAIRAFDEPKILIMGGSSKGADFSELAGEISRSNVKFVVLMGNTTNDLREALGAVGYKGGIEVVDDGSESMRRAVKSVVNVAGEGDVVLLAPACASFDLFKDYKDRGEQFKRAVSSL